MSCEPTPNRQPSPCDHPTVPLRNFEAIVLDYLTHHNGRGAGELAHFVAQPTLAAAVREASFARGPDGRRLSHQRRIRPDVLAACYTELSRTLRLIEEAPDFEALHEVVKQRIGSIEGVGELMVYDTSVRIAAWRKLEPRRVFLHAGTREGAKRLGLEHRAESLSLEVLPIPLRALSARQAEDVLCIYKDQFTAPLQRRRLTSACS